MGFVSRHSSEPVGSYKKFAYNVTDAELLSQGYLPCDGTTRSRTTYAELFAKLSNGAIYGTGDGSTTFTLPNAARKALVGSGGAGSGTLANTVGASGGSETTGMSHTHTAGNFTAAIGGFEIQSPHNVRRNLGSNFTSTTNADYGTSSWGGGSVGTTPGVAVFGTSDSSNVSSVGIMQPSMVARIGIKF